MLKLLMSVVGAGPLAAKFQRAAKRTPSKMEQSLKKAAYLVQRAAKQNLTGGNPLNVRSGRLRSSVAVDVKGLEARVGTNVKYGAIHEKGKIIHSSGLMVFEIGGNTIKTKRVTIPARPWLGPALERNRAKIVGMMDKGVKAMIREAGL